LRVQRKLAGFVGEDPDVDEKWTRPASRRRTSNRQIERALPLFVRPAVKLEQIEPRATTEPPAEA
jgi:hypothetical protein